jgi:hypothetical protein
MKYSLSDYRGVDTTNGSPSEACFEHSDTRAESGAFCQATSNEAELEKNSRVRQHDGESVAGRIDLAIQASRDRASLNNS